jgi:single-stranded-DNA-specific exonuclease
VRDLSRTLGISTTLASLLVLRGLHTPAAAAEFLDAGRHQLHDPFLLKDMDKAVRLIEDHLQTREPFLVYGDYDVDGVTATTIVVQTLRYLGAPVTYHIPNRFTEGYGLNEEALRRYRAEGFRFILSVDTGISALQEADLARQLGFTLVITDHHEPGPVLPRADAVINPKRPDCPYPFKGLSGGGVAFKLATALLGPDHPLVSELLDVVALGTIADVMPLVGENRALVKEGLQALAVTQRVGLRALMEVAGVTDGKVTPTHVGFALGPRINALGRMGDASQGVELFLTDDPARARSLAELLDAENRHRQVVEQDILTEALAQAEAMPPDERDGALVLAGDGWHHGVVGIVASRMVETYYRPSILLAIDGDEAKGSARSIPGFHLFRALQQCEDLLLKYGGHAAAAGMTLRTEHIPELRRRLNQLAREWIHPEDRIPRLQVDGWLHPGEFTADLVSELQRLEPFGAGNPAPLLASRNLVVQERREVGKEGGHLKLRLAAPGDRPVDGIGFGMAAAPVEAGHQVHVAGQPEVNVWNGTSRLQWMVKDLQVVGSGLGISEPEPVAIEHLLGWDPARGLEAAPDRIGPATLPPVAAARAAEGEPHADEADARVSALAAAVAAGPVTLLAASPWSAAVLAHELVPALRSLSCMERPVLGLGGTCAAAGGTGAGAGPDLAGARLLVTCHGLAGGLPGDRRVVLWHPPYHAGAWAELVQGGALALWQPEDWQRVELSLGWVYPDRADLVALYKALSKAGARLRAQKVEELLLDVAAAWHEPVGAWTMRRLQAGLAIFAELGLVETDTDHRSAHMQRVRLRPTGDKMNLDQSAHFRRGVQLRAAFQALRTALAGGAAHPVSGAAASR